MIRWEEDRYPVAMAVGKAIVGWTVLAAWGLFVIAVAVRIAEVQGR